MSADYLRKRFAERLWDSPLTEGPDSDTDTSVARLVEGLLLEAEGLLCVSDPATLETHARGIQNAIQAAAADGYELDNGSGYPLGTLELNTVVNGDIKTWVEIAVPPTTY